MGKDTVKGNMKACVLHKVGDFRCEEVKIPVIKEDEVLLKIKASGVCGSDVQRVFEKGTYYFPAIPGHEFSGEIVDVYGEEDKELLGRKSSVFPLIPCRKCSSCEVGEFAQCSDYNYYGSRCDGAFAEYLAVKKWNLVLIPRDKEVSFKEAAMCEPTAVAIHALSQVGVNLGDNVAVYGAGTIGIIIAKVAKIWGAKEVFLIDIDEKKLDFARKLGFKNVINSMKENAPEAIAAATDGGADVVIEGTGASAAFENCVLSAKTFGRVVLMGNPLKDMSLSQKAYWAILRKQLLLKGTWNSSFNAFKNDWAKAIDIMPQLGLEELITHAFALDDAAKAIEVLRDKSEFVMKSMYIIV